MDGIEIGFTIIIVILLIIGLAFAIVLGLYYSKLNPQRPLKSGQLYEYFYKLQPKLSDALYSRLVDQQRFISQVDKLSNYKLYRLLSGADKFC